MVSRRCSNLPSPGAYCPSRSTQAVGGMLAMARTSAHELSRLARASAHGPAATLRVDDLAPPEKLRPPLVPAPVGRDKEDRVLRSPRAGDEFGKFAGLDRRISRMDDYLRSL